jgi:hypothetical protein
MPLDNHILYSNYYSYRCLASISLEIQVLRSIRADREVVHNKLTPF